MRGCFPYVNVWAFKLVNYTLFQQGRNFVCNRKSIAVIKRVKRVEKVLYEHHFNAYIELSF